MGDGWFNGVVSGLLGGEMGDSMVGEVTIFMDGGLMMGE